MPSLRFPGVYQLDIPQGNIITQEMIDQLRPGLNKRQIIFILGTPLVRDPYNQDRWDYLYSYQPGGEDRTQERVSVYFENNLMTHFDGDFTQTPEDDTPSADTDDTASSEQDEPASEVEDAPSSR